MTCPAPCRPGQGRQTFAVQWLISRAELLGLPLCCPLKNNNFTQLIQIGKTVLLDKDEVMMRRSRELAGQVIMRLKVKLCKSALIYSMATYVHT